MQQLNRPTVQFKPARDAIPAGVPLYKVVSVLLTVCGANRCHAGPQGIK